MKWTRDAVERLKKARNEAIVAKQESFDFEGQEVLVTYSKFLILYLENRFGPKVSFGDIKAAYESALEDEG